MQFLCLVHIDRDLAKMTAAEQAEFDRENKAYGEWLQRDGRAVMFSSLHEPQTATLIRSREGRVSMTDGPYVETKEHVGGFIVIEAKNRDEVVAMIRTSPVARIGTIEVRPSDYVAPIGPAG